MAQQLDGLNAAVEYAAGTCRLDVWLPDGESLAFTSFSGRWGLHGPAPSTVPSGSFPGTIRSDGTFPPSLATSAVP
jgi:hypothetical protein